MNEPLYYDVAVIGAGPAGIAAALAAEREGASVILIEREARAGGILKQCIHDGFGVIRFGEKLSGSEYAAREIDALRKSGVALSLLTFATAIERTNCGITLTLVGRKGVFSVVARSLVLATGCRERTARQVAIHGTRPAGLLTAGTAQYYTNILGQLPTKRCVILGSGDIGLIMARRLTLEGAEVLGVYEAKPTPSGLSRNIAQCLHDFDIPLYTGKTVTRVFGDARLEAVEICDVDAQMCPVEGTERVIPCDGLIISVGLIPENELAEKLNVPLSAETKGPVCDQNYMTAVEGVFCCGNALHVNDLADYVSESGEAAGKQAARYTPAARAYRCVEHDENFLYVTPQRVDLSRDAAEVICFFRSLAERGQTTLRVKVDGREILKKKYRLLRPPEMERLALDLSAVDWRPDSTIRFEMEETL